jgi:glycosyltransferase involved in cell wall biosynthesis
VNAERSVQRVLQIHTRYRQPGGEDLVVEAERRLLEEAGVEVRQVIFDNADLRESESLAGDLRLAASAIWSRAAERRVRTELKIGRPQVVHVHNTFSAASPSVYSAAAAHAVPVVQTLHNYRLVCPAAVAFRDGRACTDCVGLPIAVPAVVHACVRGSRAQSAVAGATIAVHRALGTFRHKIGLYLALTAFQRELLVRGGFPAQRIRVIPNFLEPDPGEGTGQRSGVLYVGRLSVEKGIATLLAAGAEVPGLLRVAGDGPLAPLVEQASAAGKIVYLGPLARSAVVEELGRTVALVLPSVWFEGFPLVVLEAFASGTPVIASRIGSLAEVIDDGVTGLLAEPHATADLVDRIRWALDHPDEMRRMGLNARRCYETRFRGQSHLAALMEAYAWVGGGGRSN